MFYITKPVVFVTEDEDIANELRKLSKDEFAFSDYISSLVENDIKLKMGKRFISEKSIVEEDVTALAKVGANNSNVDATNPLNEILSKLDQILSMGNQPNSRPMPSVGNLNNLSASSTFVEPPKEKSVAIDVEHQAVKDLPKPQEKPIKKKKKMGLGKSGLDVLSKMKAMQK